MCKSEKKQKNRREIKLGNGRKNPRDPSDKVRETTVERIYGKGKYEVCN